MYIHTYIKGSLAGNETCLEKGLLVADQWIYSLNIYIYIYIMYVCMYTYIYIYIYVRIYGQH